MNCVIINKRASIPRNFQKGSQPSAEHITVSRGAILVDVTDKLFDLMRDMPEVFTCIKYQN